MSRKRSRSKNDVECPMCGFGFELESRLAVNDYLDCPDCGIALQVTKVLPFRIKITDNPPGLNDVPDELDYDNDYDSRLRW